jgi:hypothetical protein
MLNRMKTETHEEISRRWFPEGTFVRSDGGVFFSPVVGGRWEVHLNDGTYILYDSVGRFSTAPCPISGIYPIVSKLEARMVHCSGLNLEDYDLAVLPSGVIDLNIEMVNGNVDLLAMVSKHDRSVETIGLFGTYQGAVSLASLVGYSRDDWEGVLVS